jgi:hypothetical protein
MPRLTILNHWQRPVGISVNNAAPVTVEAGGKLEEVLNGPVQLRATATGNDIGFIRDGNTADGLVQNRVLVVEVDPNAAQFTFTVS